MITRQEYLNNSRALHHAYFLEIAKEACVRLPESLLQDCRDELAKDGRAHFNGIPVARWDKASWGYDMRIRAALKARGDTWSPSCSVCALKALAVHTLLNEGLQIPWHVPGFEWIPCTSDDYFEALGEMTPQERSRGGFLVGEASDHVGGVARYAAFWGSRDEYFKGSYPLSVAAFLIVRTPYEVV
jgi:hypothetical protein